MALSQERKTDWSWRSELWRKRAEKTGSNAKSQRCNEPLLLCGHGISFRVEAGSLLIRNGFTHYPQAREEFRFFPGSLNLPRYVILLDGSGNISIDVLNWLAEQNVALIRLTWRGQIAIIAAPHGYSANPHRVQWQRETRADHTARMNWCIDLISQKIISSILTLEKVIPKSAAWEKAMSRAYADLSTLELAPPSTIESLRVIEANSAAAYFRSWKGLPIKWRGTTRRPIPNEWRAIGSRTSQFNIAGNRNASHPINAMLNYAYTALESRKRLQAIAEGYDPTIGIMHESRPGASAFIFDIMEPERALVDRALIDFVRKSVFDPADFVLRSDGVVRLNPQLARIVAALAH